MVSIIVPVYNTEIKKLNRCFDSINKIRGTNYECIIVDDGSIADIESYCKSYCKEHRNFFYYRKNNGGVSSARNEGIKRANGEYIIFVDSDDCINKQYYDNLSAELLNYDLILSDICLIDRRKKFRWHVANTSHVTVELLVKCMVKDGRINGPVAKLIKKEFILKNNIYFDEDMISGEDANFLMDILLSNPKVYYTNYISYYYYREHGSGLNRIKKNIDKYFLNMNYQYEKTIFCINSIIKEPKENKSLIIEEYEAYIKAVFNGVLDAKLIGIPLNRIESYIDTCLKHINCTDIHNLKCHIEYMILTGKSEFLMFILARLRKLYLKLKGLG